MTYTRFGTSLAVVTIAALALTGCAANEVQGSASDTGATAAKFSGTLNGIGSSAQGTAQTTWATGFQTANPDVTINYDPQGSGAGRSAFIAGSSDFAGSDAALKDEELAQKFQACAADSKAIDLPVYISPIAIAYNVAGVDDLKLDANTIAGIFKGTITTWNDKAIAAQNPGAALPGARIVVVHRSDDSGTTQNFTEYLAANAKGVWDKPASQTFPYTIGDAAKGTSGVADATKNAKNSITYIDESGASGLQIAQLKVGGAYTKISAQGAAQVVAASPLVTGRAANDLAININRTDTSAGAWPLVLVSYAIACDTYKDASQSTLVKGYLDYVVSADGQQAAAEKAGSAPLSAELTTKVKTAIASIK